MNVTVADLKLPLLLQLLLPLATPDSCQSSLRWKSGAQVHPFTSSTPQKTITGISLFLQFNQFLDRVTSCFDSYNGCYTVTHTSEVKSPKVW